MYTVFVKLLSGDILPLSVEDPSMELVRQRLADHLGCHMAQVTLFRLEEEEKPSEDSEEEKPSEDSEEEKASEDSEEEKPSEDSEEDIPFVDGGSYGVVVHSTMSLHLSLQSGDIMNDSFTYHVLRNFTLSLFTPIPYRLLHEIHFYYDEDTPRFYPDDGVRSHPRMTYITVEEEGEDSLYGLIENDPFLQADCFDREEVGREAERLFQKYMADLDTLEGELLTDEELEEPEEL